MRRQDKVETAQKRLTKKAAVAILLIVASVPLASGVLFGPRRFVCLA